MNAKLLNIYFKKMLYGIEHSHGKVMQKSKMAVWGGLTKSCEKKRSEKKRSEKQRRKVRI